MPPLVLCTATNETYAIGAAVVLSSALRHLAPDPAPVSVYVLDGGIRPATWAKLARSLTLTGRAHRLIRLSPSLARFQGLPQDWGSSVMTYARLALPELMDEPRVLYLDADMVVQADLSPLAHLDLQGKVVAAGPNHDYTLAFAGLPCAELGLPPDAPYFQAGVLVIDLPRWREIRLSERALDYLRTWPRHTKHWDQSALNALLLDQWLRVPATWNTDAWPAQEGKAGYSLDAAVLHYTGPNKPWLLGHDRGPAADRFYAALRHTAWGSWRPSTLRQMLKQIRYRLSRLRKKT
jgi:lipopolysaccharide biosynthesis glycosyltransferase